MAENIPQIENWVQICPWQSPKVLLLANTGKGLQQAHTLTDKRQMVKEASGVAAILVIWPGEWSSTARALTAPADVEAVYRALLTPTQLRKYEETGVR